MLIGARLNGGTPFKSRIDWALIKITCISLLVVFFRDQVKFWTTSRHQRKAGKYAAAGLMFVLWTWTFLLASSSELHRLLHSDAQSQNHHCVVTQVKEHAILSGISIVEVPVFPMVVLAQVPRHEFQFLSSSYYRLSPSRAPPFISSSAVVAG